MKLKLSTTFFLSVIAAIFSISPISAADAPVKREMRSAWVATVWRLDWPSTLISSTGNATQIAKQQADLTTMLDSLEINNMNAVNFQVRSRCDAMYKSSYEPWSSDLVSERGMDPGWDPLEWIVDECHNRGMECHAWINPYRYESQVNQWDGTPKCYREEHPEWLLDVKGASILNPALPEVRQRIVDIIKEIITNYDVDGILFDDYFYLSGTPNDATGDGPQYEAYVAAGGTMSVGDWRRENVNMMVADVYAMIQEVKPWVRFGISPAGVACTNAQVALKYGVDPCPSGSDWQYNDIYSDPLAWISSQNLDYISPQVYWTIGYSSADYSLITPWWAEIAAKWNRHFYTSHSISSLTAQSKASTMSLREATIAEAMTPKASGPNNSSFEEFANEIRLNRECTQNDAPGSIFYSCKFLYKTAPKFAHYLKTTVFNTPALIPTMTHKPGYNPGNITNLSRSGATLSWNGFDNVRYTVYAVPTSLPIINFNKDVEYLLGTSYATSFTIPDDKLSGYTYAVCVLDRYGYEYSPTFIGTPTQILTAPTLTYPVAGEVVEAPFEFKWNAVDGASSYILEIASDANFQKLTHTRLCNTTSCSTNELEHLTYGKKLYWRVRSCANAYSDGVSTAREFTPMMLQITSPKSGSVDMPLNPTITWSIANREATLEIATATDFNASEMVISTRVNGGTYTIPENTLGGYTTYFARLKYTKNGEELYTDAVSFRTIEIIPSAPVIRHPYNGKFGSEDYISAWVSNGTRNLRFEVSNSTTFGRTRYVEDAVDGVWHTSKKAGEITISNKNLVAGTTYYIRVRANYNSSEGEASTAWSEVVAAEYIGEGSGIDAIQSNSTGAYIIPGEEPMLNIGKCTGQVSVSAVSTTGIDLGTLYNGSADSATLISLKSLGKGIFIIIVDSESGRDTIKASL